MLVAIPRSQPSIAAKMIRKISEMLLYPKIHPTLTLRVFSTTR